MNDYLLRPLKMKNKLLILVLSVVLCSCIQSRQEKEEYFAQHIIDINNPVKISIDEFITDIDTIRLEAIYESFMKNAFQMRIMNDKFYILSNNHTCILIFDLQGKYLSQINDRGNGPNEYVRIGSFEVDHVNKRIIISDSFSKKILVYNEDGKQLDVIRLDFHPQVIVSHKDRFINFYSGSKHQYTNPEAENYNLHFLDSKGKFISSAITNETPNRIDVFSSHSINSLDNGDILFHPVLGNIIYKINDDSIDAYYAFNNLSKYKLLSKKDKKKFISSTAPNGESHFKEKEDQGYLLTWGEVLELTDYTFFGFFGRDKKRYLYYSKKSSKTILVEPENVEGDKNLVRILMSYPSAVNGNRFYISPSFFEVDQVKNSIKNEKLKTFFENTDFDSNPVIISFSINIPED